MTNKKAQLGIILLTVFIDLIGFGIVIPILPLYAKHFGATEWTNGLLVGSFSCMQFIFAPLLGRLSDRVGRRPVLLVSLLGTAVGFTIMGFAQTLTWLFVARIVDGISGGNISTAQAYIADITSPEERSKTMAYIGAAFGLGFMVGPGIGGLLGQHSISAPYFFAGGLALINAILVFIRLPESLSPEHRATTAEAAPIKEVFKHGWHLPSLMACYFFSITGFAIMTTNFTLFTNYRFNYGALQNGELFLFIGFIGVLVQGGIIRRLLKTRSEKSLALLGVALMAIGMALLPEVHSLGPLLVVAAIIGTGNSFVTPTLNGLASRSAERTWQGRVAGLMQSAGSLARWIGPMIAGTLLARDVHQAYYGRTPFWAAAVILCIALFLVSRLPAKPITATA